jgi:hypothetical protein
MAKKTILLRMFTVALVFGLIIIGCDDESTTPEPEQPVYTGSLLGNGWHNSVPISDGTSEDIYNEKKHIDNNTTDDDDDTGFLFDKNESASQQDDGIYYGVKVDNKWIKISRGYAADGRTEVEKYCLIFSSDWKMTKWETDYYGNKERELETKPFDEVDTTHIKIDNATYKYTVSVSKTRDINFNYTDTTENTYHITGTFKMHILKIWFNGEDSAPEIFLYPDMQKSSTKTS